MTKDVSSRRCEMIASWVTCVSSYSHAIRLAAMSIWTSVTAHRSLKARRRSFLHASQWISGAESCRVFMGLLLMSMARLFYMDIPVRDTHSTREREAPCLLGRDIEGDLGTCVEGLSVLVESGDEDHVHAARYRVLDVDRDPIGLAALDGDILRTESFCGIGHADGLRIGWDGL